jgi:acyl-CoA dehydrogenase
VERVAAVAAKHAAAVDHDSRVPAEAIAAARAERLLGAAIPSEFGGEGASIGDIVDFCYTLGRACASTAMIFAMHQTKVACIARHGRGSAWHQRLKRHIASEQLLLASSTTEGNRGGDLRNSAAPIKTHEGRIKLERMATSSPTARPPMALSPRRGARLTRRAAIRCSWCSSKTTRRSSAKSAGMRSACAAPRARAISSSPPV